MLSQPTAEDYAAVAKFLREQAVRLPHAQRRAAMGAADLIYGIDLGRDSAGLIGVSIPVRVGDVYMGDVCFSLQLHEDEHGEDGATVEVIPLAVHSTEGAAFFRPYVEETVEAESEPLITIEADAEEDDEEEEGEQRIDPDDYIWVKDEASSTDSYVVIESLDGKNSKVVSPETWAAWTLYQLGED